MSARLSATEPFGPAEAQAEIDVLLRDPTGPLWDGAHPGHAAAAECLRRLHALAATAPPPAAPEDLIPLVPLPVLPNGQAWDVREVNQFVEAANALGMPAPEAGEWLQYVADQIGKPAPAPEATIATLRQEWGADFDQNALATWLAVQRFPAPVQVLLTTGAPAHDPKIVRRLAQLGAALVLSWQYLRSVSGDRMHPYWSAEHPEHAEAVRAFMESCHKIYGMTLV